MFLNGPTTEGDNSPHLQSVRNSGSTHGGSMCCEGCEELLHKQLLV